MKKEVVITCWSGQWFVNQEWMFGKYLASFKTKEEAIKWAEGKNFNYQIQ